MSSGNVPEDPKRSPSEVEKAMSANARSRDGQGKAKDRALREHHVTMADEAKERASRAVRHGQAAHPSRSPVTPEARSISDTLQDAEADRRADDEGMGKPR